MGFSDCQKFSLAILAFVALEAWLRWERRAIPVDGRYFKELIQK
jgi:hypothetical protein